MSRYVPAVTHRAVRAGIGLLLAVASIGLTAGRAGTNIVAPLAIFGTAWFVTDAITHKYTHKYAYRYYPYLIASHTKAAIVMALLLGFGTSVIGPSPTFSSAIWEAFGLFALFDLMVSIPRRSGPLIEAFDHDVLTSRAVSAQPDTSLASDVPASAATGASEDRPTLADFASDLDAGLNEYISESVPGACDSTTVSVVTDRNIYRHGTWSESRSDLVISRIRINDMRRINRFLIACGHRLNMGGYFVCHYEELETIRARLSTRYGRLFFPVFALHFGWHRVFPKIPGLNRLYFMLTDGRSRNLSKAEVWGRLSYCGMKVVSEQEGPDGRYVTAQRIALPITNKKPSYYPIVALNKVGLDGQMLRTHKVRSMYPFSEFLQRQIFEDHGLATTGKIKDDFRLTEYGKYMRRYWLDELPQIFDWLRGDIKLVGIRATSPHFLSLYPEDFIDLYIRIKPGLIPPLFDDNTDGFDQIVQIEFEYLKRYSKDPTRTDLEYLWRTLTDILFRGVRSR